MARGTSNPKRSGGLDADGPGIFPAAQGQVGLSRRGKQVHEKGYSTPDFHIDGPHLTRESLDPSNLPMRDTPHPASGADVLAED